MMPKICVADCPETFFQITTQTTRPAITVTTASARRNIANAFLKKSPCEIS